MRVRSLTLAAVGAALLAPVALPALAHPQRPARYEGGVTAAELLARARGCVRVSEGLYSSDAGKPAVIPVCGVDGAVYWKADMDIDCDGRPSPRCNRETDPWFQPATSFLQSDGRHLRSESLPFVVVPAASRVWDYRVHGIKGGSVAAVVHGDRVEYAVVGDTGPRNIIGEASYATAEALGIRPDPRTGGTASGVTYIVFEDSEVTPIEDHEAAVELGEELARKWVKGSVLRRGATMRGGATN
ncbi:MULTISPECIES: glycoside hydrolase family 75 protein [unclassified Streptomyces]|uniref:glycoside hydrolase family 75 protein n=1 Tax=unclassified Streptomyces TaxID=2593676 RepID=UPI002E76B7C7|nr:MULTISPECIES: glycoside hydrolase family 75 protein [unclassified Streptomyces]MEE1761651.1 glycoside hydrolase family 75 protein [Streptomyces sp. SP18BB07]MEE1830332.1 glycoside hydrolase family 75 protein [Streptomyces sp. SP17KL33]